MSDMTDGETIERFREGLTKAAARARELAMAKGSANWLKVASMLDAMREQGTAVHNSKPLTRTEVVNMLDARQKTMVIN